MCPAASRARVSYRSTQATRISSVVRAGTRMVVFRLEKGALVELRPTPEGVLIQPAKVVSALSPEGKAAAKGIVRRYRRAFDALAKGERKIAER